MFFFSRLDFSMKISSHIAAYLFLVALLTAALPSAPLSAVAYVEPSLVEGSESSRSVIVTTDNIERTARVVKRLGGEVTADLWLIDALAATLPSHQIQVLARQPGVRSIVANKGVRSAESNFDGWVTNRRIPQGTISLADHLSTPLVPLPDGGMAAVSDSGTVQIITPHGGERNRTHLSGGPYRTAPQVDAKGNLYIAGENKVLHSLSPAGTLRWTFKGSQKFNTSPALSNDGATIYVVDEKGKLHAVDAETGQLRWLRVLGNGDRGDVLAAPVVGTDGTIYLITEKGFLAAVQPDGNSKWSIWLPDGRPFKLPPQIGSDGSLYVAGEEMWIHALNADGSEKYRFHTAEKILVQTALAKDGSLYISTEKGTLYALNPDGSLRFQFEATTEDLLTAPVFSPDEKRVYVASKKQELFAVDATSGEALWQHKVEGDLLVRPTVDVDGSIHLLDTDKTYVVLNDLGVEIAKHRFNNSGQQPVVIGKTHRRSAYVATEDKILHIFSLLPHTWDGSPDVQATDDPTAWKLVNPVAIDVGADVLHTPHVPDHEPITGEGVTVAVLDSGIYVGEELPDLLPEMAEHFLGQADFVDESCADSGLDGTQFDGYCFVDADDSRDPYGHGSHVAGIIWNNFVEKATTVVMGIAPGANILSVRTLDENGMGTYADAIEGIQYIVANKDVFNVRVLNISISAYATAPYFVDPLNRAVEEAWADGIVVVAAAGNEGPEAETITVPGNDPYVITVGALDGVRTPGFWNGDLLPSWSATGPTLDGFIKPDVLAPGTHIVSLSHADARLAKDYPANAEAGTFFRMSGTSMATAVTSGVVALMLQAHPALTPDQVKYRLGHAALPANTSEDFPVYNILQQGLGRIWAPTAIFGRFPTDARANRNMDLQADLAHGWDTEADLAHHYQGPIQRMLSDDGSTYLYYVNEGETLWGLGAVDAESMTWIDWQTLSEEHPTWSGGTLSPSSGIAWAGGLSLPAGRGTWSGGHATWSGGHATWSGGHATWSGGHATWSGGHATWSGGHATWSGGHATWSGGHATWSGGHATWSGGHATWSGGHATWSGGHATWSGGMDINASTLSATSWVNDDGSTARLRSRAVFHPSPAPGEGPPIPDGDGGQRFLLPIINEARVNVDQQ